MDFDSRLGDALSRRRAQLRLSMEGAARMLGVSQSTYHRWESQADLPKPELDDAVMAWLEAEPTEYALLLLNQRRLARELLDVQRRGRPTNGCA